MSEDVERVTMNWPKALKDQVRDRVGQRGITGFTVEAVERHLAGEQGVRADEVRLNEAMTFAQLIADRMVMGGEHEDRMQALMEVEFPSWIQTVGWPQPMADRVRPEPLAEESAEVPQVIDPTSIQVVKRDGSDENLDGPSGLSVDDDDQAAEWSEDHSTPVAPVAPDTTGRTDLFARIMERTGGDIEGFQGLKMASEIEAPAPVEAPSEVLCPNCGGELIDGECWTCG